MHPCRPPDRPWLPGGGLQENFGRPLLHGALGATDDAGEPLRPLRVGHDHVARRQTPRLPVEAGQLLTVASSPHDDPATPETLVIEGMHRLPGLEHHVVGDVDDVADRPDAGRPQPRLHPRRRGRDVDAGDQAPDEPAAAVGCVDADQVRRDAGPILRDLRLSQRQVEDGANLSRDAEVTEEIGAVGLDLELEDGVARIELVEILARRRPGVEDQDSRRVLAQPELDGGTQHARGWKAQERLRLDPLVAQT